jgi:hypothetical protein
MSDYIVVKTIWIYFISILVKQPDVGRKIDRNMQVNINVR